MNKNLFAVLLTLLPACQPAPAQETNAPPVLVEQPAEWSFDPADDREIDVAGTVKTYAAWIAGALGLWLGFEQLDVSEKDRQDKVTKEAADAAALAAAKEAEERTLINGPSTPFRYAISGTFAGSLQPALNGATWQPSITFGNQSSANGGSIAAYTLQPASAGLAAQVVTGLGVWSVMGENEILIKGTGLYDGRARLANVPPPGSAGSGSGLTTAGGLYLSGGSVVAFEVDP